MQIISQCIEPVRSCEFTTRHQRAMHCIEPLHIVLMRHPRGMHASIQRELGRGACHLPGNESLEPPQRRAADTDAAAKAAKAMRIGRGRLGSPQGSPPADPSIADTTQGTPTISTHKSRDYSVRSARLGCPAALDGVGAPLQ